jgi:hypothetical protein
MWRQAPIKDYRDPGNPLFQCIDSLAVKHVFSQSKEEELN